MPKDFRSDLIGNAKSWDVTRGKLTIKLTNIVKHIDLVDDHWHWTGFVHPTGGLPYIANVAARSAVYELFTGIDPRPAYVKPTCDDPLCVNPDHMMVTSGAASKAVLAVPYLDRLDHLKSAAYNSEDVYEDALSVLTDMLIDIGYKNVVSAWEQVMEGMNRR